MNKKKFSLMRLVFLFFMLFALSFPLHADDDDWGGELSDDDWSEFSDWWGDDWEDSYNDFWGYDTSDCDFDYGEVTYSVPNGEGGFDTLTYSDVFDDEGNFIYDYTGPGDKDENEAVIAEIFGGGGKAEYGENGEGYLSMYIEAVQTLEDAKKSGEDLETIERLEETVEFYRDALEDYCERNSYSYTVNETNTFGVITNSEGKTICHVGDPVILCSGDFIIDDVDLSIKTRKTAFCLERHYSSGDEAQHSVPHGIFGQGWCSNIETRVIRGYSSVYDNEVPSWEAYLSSLSEYQATMAEYVEIDSSCSSIYDILTNFIDEENLKLEEIREKSGLNSQTKDLNRYVDYGIPHEYSFNSGFDTFVYVQDNGSFIVFRKNADGSFTKKGAPNYQIEMSGYGSGFCITYPVTGEKRYYSEYGLPSLFTFRNGGKIEFLYDSSMKLSEIVVDSERRLSFSWSGSNLSSVKDEATGLIVSYGYDSGRLTKVIDVEFDEKSFSYNSQGLLSRQIKADGSFVAFDYNFIEGKYRTVRTTNEEGESESFSYNIGLRTTVYTDCDGKTVTYTYDAFGRTLSESYGDGKRIDYAYDPNGFLIAKYENGSNESFEYDSLGNMTRKTYSDGSYEAWSYDGWLLTSYTQRNGDFYRYLYDSYSRLTDIFCNSLHVFHYEYDYYGNVCSRVDKNGCRTEYSYDTSGNLTGRKLYVSSEPKTESWRYDGQNRIISYTDVMGQKSEFSYSPHGLSVSLSNGLKIEEEFSQRKLLTRRCETDTVTGEKRIYDYEYDKNKNCRAVYISGIDSRGNIVQKQRLNSMEYTSSGKLKSFVECDVFDDTENSFKTEFMYDLYGNFSSATGAYYEKEGASAVKTGIFSPDFVHFQVGNAIIEKEFDKSGREISRIVKDLYGKTVSEERWIYEKRKVTHISGGKYRESYLTNAFSEVTAYIDGEGNRTDFIRDILGRVVIEKDPYGTEILRTYNGRNQIESVRFCDGSRVEYDYDKHSNCVKARDSSGVLWNAEYDVQGRLIFFSERPFNVSYSYDYDSNGNVKSVKVNGNTERKADYSADLKKTVVTDSKGNRNSYLHDENGRLISWENPLGAVSKTEYYKDGSLRSQFDFNGNIKTFSYENTTEKVKCGGGKVFEYVYDTCGNLIEAKSGLSTLFYDYDAAGLLVKQSEGAPESEVEYSYDLAKRLVKIVSKDRIISYVRGKNGEVLEISDRMKNGSLNSSQTVHFVYDRLGRETLRVYDSGESVNTFYDNSGRRILSAGYSKNLEPVFVDGLVYDSNGNIVCSLDSNFQVTLYSYDSRGRLSSVVYPYSDALSEKFKNELSCCGLHFLESSVKFSRLSIPEETYSALQKLCSMIGLGNYQINAAQNTVEERYDYDANHNLVKKTNPYGCIEYSYDCADRLVSWGNTGNAKYDNNGNMIFKADSFSESFYDYSTENRIEKISVHNFFDDDVKVYKYEYDALGRRCDLAGSEGIRTGTSYLGLSNMILASHSGFTSAADFSEHSGSKSRTKNAENVSSGRYVFLDDEKPSSKQSLFEKLPEAGGEVYPLYDYRGGLISFFTPENAGKGGLGRKILMTDSAGTVKAEIEDSGLVNHLSYDAFGFPVGSFGAFGFAGKSFDSCSKMYDFGFRDYSPDFARFSSVDPIHDGFNWYSYCEGNPVEFCDMYGLYPVQTEEQYMQNMGHVLLGTSSNEYTDLEGCLVTAIAETLSALTGVPVSNDYINSVKSCFSGGNISWSGIASAFGLGKTTDFEAKAKVVEADVKNNCIISMVNGGQFTRMGIESLMKGEAITNGSAMKGLIVATDINHIKSTLAEIEKNENPLAVIAQVNYDGKHLHFVGIGTEVKTINGQQVVAVTATSKYDSAACLGNNRKSQGWFVNNGKVYLPLALINRIDTVSKAQ